MAFSDSEFDFWNSVSGYSPYIISGYLGKTEVIRR
jgi:hypothetical protein